MVYVAKSTTQVFWGKVRGLFYKVAHSSTFNVCMSLLTILNGILLMVDRHGISREEQSILEWINLAFCCIYLLELVTKVIGLGPTEFARDRYNLYDAVISCLSAVEIVVFFNQGFDTEDFKGFKALRLLRLIKLARRSTSVNQIVSKIILSIPHTGNFLVLILIISLVFVIQGMQLFSLTLSHSQMLTSLVAQINFDSVYGAFVTVLIVTLGDSWSSYMFCYQREHYYLATVYFITLVIVTNIFLLKLFLAVQLSVFDQKLDLSDKDSELGALHELQDKVLSRLSECLKRVRKTRLCRSRSPKRRGSNRRISLTSVQSASNQQQSDNEVPVTPP